MIALAVSALTEQQRELVRCLVSEGRPPEDAAKLAGYHPKSVYRTLRLPAVAAAISESIQLDLAAVGAPLAYRVAKSLLQDESISARVRADLSMKVLDRAGHIAPTRKDLAPRQKALSEIHGMSSPPSSSRTRPRSTSGGRTGWSGKGGFAARRTDLSQLAVR